MQAKTNRKDETQFGIESRWTPTLAKHGFTPIASVFLASYSTMQPPITAAEAMLIVHLMSFKWTSDAPFPAITTLAKLMGHTDRYVRKLCKSLESVGYLRRIGRDGSTNKFDLSGLFAKLEAHLEAKAKHGLEAVTPPSQQPAGATNVIQLPSTAASVVA